MSDLLREIFDKQWQLNNEIFRKQDLRDRDGRTLTMEAITAAVSRGELGPNHLPNLWLRNYLKALESEAGELGEELLWKWWSKDRLDLQNIRVEIVDLMHFLTSLALCAGLDAAEFHRLYTQKHAVNQQRQEQGYSRATKDETDNQGVR